MINFDELNAMIDKVNDVIVDVNDDTKRQSNELKNLKEVAYTTAVFDLLKYCDIFNKAIGDCTKNLQINIPFQDGEILFTRYMPYCSRYGTYAVEINVGRDDYRIIENHDGSKALEYKAINHSYKPVIWFEDLASDWDNVKNKIDERVVDGVNHILKRRAEIAHEENKKAKENLEKFLES